MTRSTARRAAACLPVFGFAAYPIVFIASVNAGVLPLDAIAIGRGLAVAWAGASALLLVLRALPWSFEARAAWAGLTLLLFAFYQPVLLVLAIAGPAVAPYSGATALIFAAGVLAAVTALVRPWQERPRSPLALGAAAAALLGISVYTAWANGAWSGWQPDVEERAARFVGKQTVVAPERDIFYVVLDGFGGGDVLQSQYRLDITAFSEFLAARGFEVPRAARSNYSQTFLSLASALNLSYLDDISSTLGEGSPDRRPLKRLIDRNALMAAARAAGYRVFAVGSAYSATRTIEAADVCVCDRRGLAELEHEALISTPLAALPLARWTYDTHRAKILDGLDAVEAIAHADGPTFVFAHVIAPHPPFVFDAEGGPRQPHRPFSFRDGDHFDGTRSEYVDGYRDQTRFLIDRLSALIERLQQRPGPAPVIVMHGDHGPGSGLRWSDPSASDLNERMSIFAAYAFPGAPAVEPHPEVTPVNIARTLARRYLGVDAPDLRDASYFSTWEAPYRFIPVAAGAVDARRVER